MGACFLTWFNEPAEDFEPKSPPAVFKGVFTMYLIVFVAFLYGCATVVSKMINYRAAQELGTWNGSLVNYVVASILALILLLFSPYAKADLQACTAVPVYLYAGGAFGVIAFVITIITLNRMKVFQSTILLLAGQLLAGILFDVAIFGNFTWVKFTGVVLVTTGILWDKKVTAS